MRGFMYNPGRGGINPAISITNFVGHISRTVGRHDADNNGQDSSAV